MQVRCQHLHFFSNLKEVYSYVQANFYVDRAVGSDCDNNDPGVDADAGPCPRAPAVPADSLHE